MTVLVLTVCMLGNTRVTEMSPYLDNWMPVGNRFSGTREHFTPVVSAEAVCIITNSAHTNDLIMAHSVGTGGRERGQGM